FRDGGFARAVLTHKGEDLAGADLLIDILRRGGVAIELGELFQPQQCIAGHDRPPFWMRRTRSAPFERTRRWSPVEIAATTPWRFPSARLCRESCATSDASKRATKPYDGVGAQ